MQNKMKILDLAPFIPDRQNYVKKREKRLTAGAEHASRGNPSSHEIDGVFFFWFGLV